MLGHIVQELDLSVYGGIACEPCSGTGTCPGEHLSYKAKSSSSPYCNTCKAKQTHYEYWGLCEDCELCDYQILGRRYYNSCAHVGPRGSTIPDAPFEHRCNRCHRKSELVLHVTMGRQVNMSSVRTQKWENTIEKPEL